MVSHIVLLLCSARASLSASQSSSLEYVLPSKHHKPLRFNFHKGSSCEQKTPQC